MALTGNENNINILIQSTFDNKGFQSAITNINQLKSQLSGISSGMGQFAGTVKEAAKGLVQVSNSAKETTTSTSSCMAEAKRLSEAYRAQREEIKQLTQGSTYLGQSIREAATYTATNTSALISMGTGTQYAVTGLNSLQGAAKNTNGILGTMSGAVNGVKGYMGGLITQTISVGDIFGYYIGTMALNAVNDFVFGILCFFCEFVYNI